MCSFFRFLLSIFLVHLLRLLIYFNSVLCPFGLSFHRTQCVQFVSCSHLDKFIIITKNKTSSHHSPLFLSLKFPLPKWQRYIFFCFGVSSSRKFSTKILKTNSISRITSWEYGYTLNSLCFGWRRYSFYICSETLYMFYQVLNFSFD